MPTIKETKFIGLQPGLDRRQVKSAHVIEGRNFSATIQGPSSDFGAIIHDYVQWANAELFNTFKVNNQWLMFTTDGVFGYDNEAFLWYPIYKFRVEFDEVFPWTMAQVGGKFYFAKKGSDLIEYAPAIDAWNIITIDVPAGLVAVTQSAGRLIALGADIVAWSYLGDGSNFVPDVDEGSGAQSLALIGGGDPIAIRSIINGFITYTKNGVLISTYAEAGAPFRHLPDQVQNIPVSPYCIVDLDSITHLMLDQTGFFVRTAEQSQIWQPIMSEHFREAVFEQIDFETYGVVSMFYNRPRQQIIVSYSTISQPGRFDIAYVYSLRIDDWGIFNWRHRGFVNFLPLPSVFNDPAMAYFNDTGYMVMIDNKAVVESYAFTPDYFIQHGSFDYPVQVVDGVNFMPTQLITFEVDPSMFPSNPGIYNRNAFIDTFEYQLSTTFSSIEGANEPFSDGYGFTDGFNFGSTTLMAASCLFSTALETWAVELLTPVYSDLDSYVVLGLFRMNDPDAVDRLHHLLKLVVGTDIAPTDFVSEDWDISLGEEDWLNDELPDEDWGFDVAIGSNYSVQIFSTIDGYNVYEDNMQVPDLLDKLDYMRSYACYITGLWSLVRISTENQGDNYRVKELELLAEPAGRLI